MLQYAINSEILERIRIFLKFQKKNIFLKFQNCSYIAHQQSAGGTTPKQTKKKASESDPVSTLTETADTSTTTPGAQTDTNPPVNIEIGHFAALRLKEYDDEVPQIARVMAIRELDLDIEWWIGRYNDTWNQWKTRGQPNVLTVHKNANIMAPISHVLTGCQMILLHLKKLYEDIEFM